MTNCIFYSLIFILFVNFTVGSIKYSEVNRTFMSLYRGVFEVSTNSFDESGEVIDPFYDEEKLETYLTDYFKENISKYVSDFSIKIYYFNRDDNSLCYTSFCKDVNVTLKAKINFLFEYEKSQNFSIVSRNEYGK